MYDVIIIGAGPAGLTAAQYLARARRKTLVIERFFGTGQTGVINEIVNYPGLITVNGYELLETMRSQALNFGAEFIDDEVTAVDTKEKKVTTLLGNEYTAKAIVFATGCKSRELGLRNEQMLLGRGISYCSTCDGGFYRDRVVAVAGKGAKAIADAKYLSAIAKTTYLITTDEIAVDGITTVSGSVTELNGNPLEEIVVVKTDGEKLTIKVDALFVAVGLNPVTTLLAGLVERDGDGFIVTDEDCETSEKGIFAVGDIRVKKVRQIVTAAADGAIAAAAAIKRIKEK